MAVRHAQDGALGNRTAKTAVYETIETPPPGEIRFYRIREQAWGVSES